MEKEIMHQSFVDSFESTKTFPEVVRLLQLVGVESYHVDLLENRVVFHMPEGSFYADSFEFEGPRIASDFSEEKLEEAIRAIQSHKMSYKEFLNFIMLAGVTGYSVFLDGKQTIYFGRKGEVHVEKFPSK